jgi:hypothetical protein
MAFNISNFKSTIDTFGGAARSSLFEVRISDKPRPQEKEEQEIDSDGLPLVRIATEKKKNALFTERELSFFCKSAAIPGITYSTTTYEAVGQLPRQYPVSMANTPFSAQFMVDSDHQVLTYFHRWMQSVLNYNNENPFAESDDGKLPFEVGYKDNYAKLLEIRHYSTESSIDKYYKVRLYNAFPIAIGDLELAWESNDSYLTLPVTFAYDNIFYDAALTGTPSNRFSRGRNLLDTLGAIAGFGNVLKESFRSGRPTSIQDAINRLTRIRNSFDNISGRRG